MTTDVPYALRSTTPVRAVKEVQDHAPRALVRVADIGVTDDDDPGHGYDVLRSAPVFRDSEIATPPFPVNVGTIQEEEITQP